MGQRATLVTYAEHVQLTTALFRGRHEEARALVSSPSFCWHSFSQFASAERLAGGLHLRLAEAKLRPAEGCTFEPSFARQSERNRNLLEQSRALQNTLAGIRFVFLKGPRLAYWCYAGLGARPSGDIDVLVHPQDVDRAAQAVQQEGLQAQSRVLVSPRLMRVFTHHIDYRGGDVRLDLHWTLRAHYSYRVDGEHLWASQQNWHYEDHTYPVLAAEYDLVLLVLTTVSEFQIGALRLRDLIDLYRLIVRIDDDFNWPSFFSQRERENIGRPCRAVLRGVLNYLSCHADAPRLVEALGSGPSDDPTLDFTRRYGRVARKLVGCALPNGPLWGNLSWWLLSLPFRIAETPAGRDASVPRLQPWHSQRMQGPLKGSASSVHEIRPPGDQFRCSS
jgi:hypothetical protein